MKPIVKYYGDFINSDNICIITTMQNCFYYYFARKPDYYIKASYNDKVNDAEYFTGAEVITNLNSLKDIIDTKPKVMIITDGTFKNPAYFNDEMKTYISKAMRELQVPKESKMRLFISEKKCKKYLHNPVNQKHLSF